MITTLIVASAMTKALVVVLVVLATAAFIGSLVVVFGRRQAHLERRLAGYEVEDAANRSLPASAALSSETKMMQQAVGFTGRLADRTGLLSKTELLLEQADVPLRPAELLFYVPVFTVMAFFITLLLTSFTVAIVVTFFVALVPIGLILRKRDSRRKQFETMLPDTLQLLAGSLRAGFSFMQGLETVSNETIDPMRRELQRVFTEARLGRPIEDALGDVAERMNSQDLAWAVMAIKIQREVGGNLAQLLDTVADTMTKRERLRREIRTLTAEGRFSAIVVSLFPPLFGAFLWTTQPDYMNKLFDETLGIIAVIAAGALTLIGWVWMQKIVDIEV